MHQLWDGFFPPHSSSWQVWCDTNTPACALLRGCKQTALTPTPNTNTNINFAGTTGAFLGSQDHRLFTELKGVWGCYARVSQLKALHKWLDRRGVRERVLKASGMRETRAILQPFLRAQHIEKTLFMHQFFVQLLQIRQL